MQKKHKLLNKAQTEISRGHYEKAIKIIRDLLLDAPNSAECLMLLGEAFLRNEQFHDALSPCARAVELDNKNLRALNNFGAALIRNNRYSDAKEIFEYAIELDSMNIDLYINIGCVYQALGQSSKCLEAAFKAVEINPGSFMAYNNLGTALGDVLQIDSSRQAFITANELNPTYLPTIINLAQLEVKVGNHLKGVELYESALKLPNLSPNYYRMIKYYLSYSYLFLGRIQEGWECYENGFNLLLPKGAFRSLRKFSQPRWDGTLVENKRILIWREQGLGDELMFSSCLRDVSRLGLSVILECDPRLVNIFKRTYPEFQVRAECFDLQNYPLFTDFELQIPLGSLPKLYRQNLNDFFNKPVSHLLPDVSKLIDIQRRLKKYKNKKLVGISWRSGQLSLERNNNYTALIDWEPLLTRTDLQFVNLQYGECENEILNVEKLFNIKLLRWNDIDLRNDLEAVLAIINQLDCVVCVDTAVSALSGASGKKTLVLLQNQWTLLGQRERYPWFPSMKPFVVNADEHVGINIKHLYEHVIN